MPARNSRKIYADGGIYHIYNRGVEKRVIFDDDQDYKVFLKNLKEYLSPIPKIEKETKFVVRNQPYTGVKRQPKNYYGQIELLAYGLVPNHFHLIIKVDKGVALKKFMHSVSTRYSMYFNKRYERVGSLFQSRYKAVLVKEENYLLHLSRYIHLNPRGLFQKLSDAYSSYGEYLGLRKTDWIKPNIILSYFNQEVLTDFKKINTYKKFVEEYKTDSENILDNITLDEES
ncbi:MAG: transposase [Candidatus Woesebacteria bacterium]|nr:transposase [Candidatus Woesebacteria bacterium]